MSANTKIEWADHTFNPWIGCTKVSPGCDHCYAKAEWEDRRHRVVWGPGQPRSLTKTWGDPGKWNKQHEAFYAQHGRRQRVFCASLADVFDNEVPENWRIDLFDLIEKTPHLDWLLLTKRIGNVAAMLPWSTCSDPWPNVWIGATVVNQAEADRDIPKLLQVPAAKRFLSMEPLLGPVDITPFLWGKNEAVDTICQNCPRDADCECGYHTRAALNMPALHWVIVGGESGPGARPMHPDWARSLRDQCQAAGMPFLFKQHGEWSEVPGEYQVDAEAADVEGFDRGRDCVITPDGRVFAHPEDLPEDVPGRWMERLGKKAAGRQLDGRTWDGVPA